MSNENQQTEDFKQRTSIVKDVFIIGVWGGIIWSGMAFLVYYLNFMDSSPKFIMTSWSDAKWIHTWLGTLIMLLIYGLLSMGVAFLYYATMKNVKSIFGGIAFGVLIWLLFLFVLRPMFPDLPKFSEININTGISSICLFILYGVFVGYSISYEFSELQRSFKNREKNTDTTG